MVGDARFVVKERMSKPEVISSPSQLVAINALAGDRPVCWRDADFLLPIRRSQYRFLRTAHHASSIGASVSGERRKLGEAFRADR